MRSSSTGRILLLQQEYALSLGDIENNLQLIGSFFPHSEVILVLVSNYIVPEEFINRLSHQLEIVTTDTLHNVAMVPLRSCYLSSSDWLLVFPAHFPLDRDWLFLAQAWIKSSFSANFVREKGFIDINKPMNPFFWFFKPAGFSLEKVEVGKLTSLSSTAPDALSVFFRDNIYSKLVSASHIVTRDAVFIGEENVNLLIPPNSSLYSGESLMTLPSAWQRRSVQIPTAGRKYLLLKGAEGFADRMECLLQAIFYCCQTTRILIVDWRDSDWSHIESYGINDILDIRGVDIMTLEDFEAYVTSHKLLSVFPSEWRHKLFLRMPLSVQRESIFSVSSTVNEGRSVLQDIATGIRPDFSEDIVVFNGYGTRVFFPEIANTLHLNPDVNTFIEEFMSSKGLQDGEYDVCHLRGGSKHWLGGSVRTDSPVWEDHNQWVDSEQYLDTIYRIYKESTQSSPKKRLVITSDSPTLFRLWKDTYRIGEYLSVTAGDMKERCGIHKVCRSTLTKQNSSKHRVNSEAVRDFVVMLRSRYLFGDSVSRYSLLALRLKQTGIRFSSFPTQ